jgi:hypothetical protein
VTTKDELFFSRRRTPCRIIQPGVFEEFTDLCIALREVPVVEFHQLGTLHELSEIGVYDGVFCSLLYAYIYRSGNGSEDCDDDNNDTKFDDGETAMTSEWFIEREREREEVICFS